MARAKVAALATVSALVAVLLAEILAALVAPSTRVTRDILGRRPIEVTPGLYREMVHDGQAYTDLQPGARGRHRLLNDYDVALRFSQLGTRSPDLAPREPGEFRVLILGDSQTFGHVARPAQRGEVRGLTRARELAQTQPGSFAGNGAADLDGR